MLPHKQPVSMSFSNIPVSNSLTQLVIQPASHPVSYRISGRACVSQWFIHSFIRSFFWLVDELIDCCVWWQLRLSSSRQMRAPAFLSTSHLPTSQDRGGTGWLIDWLIDHLATKPDEPFFSTSKTLNALPLALSHLTPFHYGDSSYPGHWQPEVVCFIRNEREGRRLVSGWRTSRMERGWELEQKSTDLFRLGMQRTDYLEGVPLDGARLAYVTTSSGARL